MAEKMLTAKEIENLNKFQKLMAYFVEHLELCNLYDQKCNNNTEFKKLKNKENKLTQEEKKHLDEIKKNYWAEVNKFCKEETHTLVSGQGYINKNFQDDIKGFCVLKQGKVSISVQYGQKIKNYISEGSYLHWVEGLAGNVSIYAEAINGHVDKLYIRDKWLDKNSCLKSVSLSDINITINLNKNDFNGLTRTPVSSNNSKELPNFYNAFVKAAGLGTMDVLKHAKNIIFTGAPGTGKTYLAKQIADLIEAQYEFVQFHPSYDYTDFVEGLRPVQKGKDIVFDRKDGIFKAFCEKALEQYLSAGGISVSALKNPKSSDEGKNIKNRINSIFAKDNDIKDKITPYVFIIDEINRGEISKIFGELFFSVDPGYRGVDGKVKTQYANLQMEPNLFDLVLLALGKIDDGDWGHFFIPENVYIIGTMNDIDRSVESMDFAFRRRFTFKEIKAKDTQAQILDGICEGKSLDTLNNAMENLNNAISAYEEFSDAYHIGGAYFRHYKDYVGQDNIMGKLWDNHIKGVLIEYLRGRPDCDKRLDELKSNYDKGLFGKIGITENELKTYLKENSRKDEIIEEIKGILQENIEKGKEDINVIQVTSMDETMESIISTVKKSRKNKQNKVGNNGNELEEK